VIVEIKPAAQADLDEIMGYSQARHGSAAADDYLNLFYACLERLRDYPESAARTRGLGGKMRQLPFGRHAIYYEFDGKTVSILRVLHQSMDAYKRLRN
jgi:toxin ParE1/3/4